MVCIQKYMFWLDNMIFPKFFICKNASKVYIMLQVSFDKPLTVYSFLLPLVPMHNTWTW